MSPLALLVAAPTSVPRAGTRLSVCLLGVCPPQGRTCVPADSPAARTVPGPTSERGLLTEAVKGWGSRTGRKSREGAAALRPSLGEDLSRVPPTHAGCRPPSGLQGLQCWPHTNQEVRESLSQGWASPRTRALGPQHPGCESAQEGEESCLMLRIPAWSPASHRRRGAGIQGSPRQPFSEGRGPLLLRPTCSPHSGLGEGKGCLAWGALSQVSLFLATHQEGRAWGRWTVPWGGRESA